jgi:LPXTG-site transpeptidase (sortase) family protein
MELPPFGLAAWFRVGPAPGAPGPAVIVGHVDSPKRPDIFYHLRKLRAGDEILVYGESGDVAMFVVDSQETVLKTQLPTERIWVRTSQAVIRLITCGGKWDKRTGHYLSNTIVYGHLVN